MTKIYSHERPTLARIAYPFLCHSGIPTVPSKGGLRGQTLAMWEWYCEGWNITSIPANQVHVNLQLYKVKCSNQQYIYKPTKGIGQSQSLYCY